MDYGNCIFCENSLTQNKVCVKCGVFCHENIVTSYIVDSIFGTKYPGYQYYFYHFLSYDIDNKILKLTETALELPFKPDKLLLEIIVPTNINLIKATVFKFFKYNKIL